MEGTAMLSSVLRSKRAVEVNIEIMRAFVRLRRMVVANAEFSRRLDALESRYDERFRIVFQAIRRLMAAPEQPQKQIGFRHDREDGRRLGLVHQSRRPACSRGSTEYNRRRWIQAGVSHRAEDLGQSADWAPWFRSSPRC